MNEKMNAVVLNGKAVEIDEMTAQHIEREMKRQKLRDKFTKLIREAERAGFKLKAYPNGKDMTCEAMFGNTLYLPLD